jgi:hypothetical protein
VQPAPNATALTNSPEELQAEREAKLAEQLTGATLVGFFNVVGAGQEANLREDRYELVRVSKVEGEMWLIEARFNYGGMNLVIPLTLPIKWAGDTPVITVDGLTVPGMGASYDARVMVYGDRYAGMWGSANYARGGTMIGRIEKTAVAAPATPATSGTAPAGANPAPSAAPASNGAATPPSAAPTPPPAATP